MSYLIFGIVVMLVTWFIDREELNKYKKEIIRINNIRTELENIIIELNGELITQKAMREGKN